MFKFWSFVFFVLVCVSLTFAQLKLDSTYVFKSLASDGISTCVLKVMIKSDGKAYSHYEVVRSEIADKAMSYFMGFSPTFSENANGGFVLRVPEGNYFAIPISLGEGAVFVGNSAVEVSCRCGEKGASCPVEVVVAPLGGTGSIGCGLGVCTSAGCGMEMWTKGVFGMGYVFLPAEGVIFE